MGFFAHQIYHVKIATVIVNIEVSELDLKTSAASLHNLSLCLSVAGWLTHFSRSPEYFRRNKTVQFSSSINCLNQGIIKIVFAGKNGYR